MLTQTTALDNSLQQCYTGAIGHLLLLHNKTGNGNAALAVSLLFGITGKTGTHNRSRIYLLVDIETANDILQLASRFSMNIHARRKVRKVNCTIRIAHVVIAVNVLLIFCRYVTEYNPHLTTFTCYHFGIQAIILSLERLLQAHHAKQQN